MSLQKTSRFGQLFAGAPESGTAASRRPAFLLQIISAIYVCFALILMLSSSSVISAAEYGSGLALFERQIVWTILGGIAFFLCVRVDLNAVRRMSPLLMLGIIVALIVVLVAGKSSGGSSRWIGVGFLRLQPTEFAKLVFAIFAADFVAGREKSRHAVAEVILPLGMVFAASAALILIQPDLGSTIMVTLIYFVVLFGSGIERRTFVRTVVLIGAAGGTFALSASYRRQRFLSFLSPVAHEATTGYQLAQSLFALGSGHLTGTGFGASSATWGFLPNAQTDFIFAVIGNQYGFLGALVVMAGYAAIGVCGVRIAMKANDRFSSLLALALTTWIVGQAVINIGGVISVMPETGIPLPFLSYGGSSLIAIICAVGLIVNIANHSRTKTTPNPVLQRRIDSASGLLLHGAPPARR